MKTINRVGNETQNKLFLQVSNHAKYQVRNQVWNHIEDQVRARDRVLNSIWYEIIIGLEFGRGKEGLGLGLESGP